MFRFSLLATPLPPPLPYPAPLTKPPCPVLVDWAWKCCWSKSVPTCCKCSQGWKTVPRQKQLQLTLCLPMFVYPAGNCSSAWGMPSRVGRVESFFQIILNSCVEYVRLFGYTMRELKLSTGYWLVDSGYRLLFKQVTPDRLVQLTGALINTMCDLAHTEYHTRLVTL